MRCLNVPLSLSFFFFFFVFFFLYKKRVGRESERGIIGTLPAVGRGSPEDDWAVKKGCQVGCKGARGAVELHPVHVGGYLRARHRRGVDRQHLVLALAILLLRLGTSLIPPHQPAQAGLRRQGRLGARHCDSKLHPLLGGVGPCAHPRTGRQRVGTLKGLVRDERSERWARCRFCRILVVMRGKLSRVTNEVHRDAMSSCRAAAC